MNAWVVKGRWKGDLIGPFPVMCPALVRCHPNPHYFYIYLYFSFLIYADTLPCPLKCDSLIFFGPLPPGLTCESVITVLRLVLAFVLREHDRYSPKTPSYSRVSLNKQTFFCFYIVDKDGT